MLNIHGFLSVSISDNCKQTFYSCATFIVFVLGDLECKIYYQMLCYLSLPYVCFVCLVYSILYIIDILSVVLSYLEIYNVASLQTLTNFFYIKIINSIINQNFFIHVKWWCKKNILDMLLVETSKLKFKELILKIRRTSHGYR